MRVPPAITEFLAWRWMPCAALTAGSLAFAGLAVLLIPSQFDGAPPSTETATLFDRPGSGSRASRTPVSPFWAARSKASRTPRQPRLTLEQAHINSCP